MSTIIIRLQNLPLTAKAADIREFFGDLKIPKGSVNIVGGSMGDAFIGFASDEDARLAMQLDGRLLHNFSIHLMLSSKREMEQVIANAQAQVKPPKSSGTITATANIESLDQKNIKSIQQTGDIPTMVPKSEVMSPSATAVHPPPNHSFLGGNNGPMQNGPGFPQSQQVHEQPALLSSDSWKTPQQKSFTSAPIAGQQSVINQQSTLGSVFPGQMQSQAMGAGNTTSGIGIGGFGSGGLQQQPLSNFSLPPPPPTTGGFHQQQQTQPRLPFAQQFGNSGPSVTSTGNAEPVVDNYFNQPSLQNHQNQSQPPSSSHQQRFPMPPPPLFGGQSQQSYFGGPPPLAATGQGQQYQKSFNNNNSLSGLFRQPAAALQQQSRPQFNRRNPNQPFGQQRPYFDKFKSRQLQEGKGAIRPTFNNSVATANNQNYRQRFPNAAGQSLQQQQFADRFGGKRRRSRSPNNSNKRFNGQQQNFGGREAGIIFGQGQQQQSANVPFYQRQQQTHQEIVKGRFCIQLSNIPYKATFSDVQSYLIGSKSNCIKVTRVYIPDRDYSDRWIVEFDNENEARTLCRFSGEINQRRIRTERISARRADEQYAVPEPERRDNKDSNGSGARSRPNRDDNRNRHRSQSRERERERGRDRDRSRHRDDRDSRPTSSEKNVKRTGANAIPVGQRLSLTTTTLAKVDITPPTIISNGPNVPPSTVFPHYTHSFDNGNSGGGNLPALIIQEDFSSVDGDGDEFQQQKQISKNDGNDNDVRPLMPPSQIHQQKQSPTLASFPFVRQPVSNNTTGPTNSSKISFFSDQLPLDLLEPEICGEQEQRKTRNGHEQSQPTFSASTSNNITQTIVPKSSEFSAEEVKLRPHLLFLEHYKGEPNARTCIRLENMPKLVFIEQLCDFLGEKIIAPHQNIARMQNGVLYINLENELSASKAATRSGQFLHGTQIGITQIKKSEMADAIRVNMIIIREMYRVTVVASGFPLMVQPYEVIAMFERFNVNQNGVEKCAVKSTDTNSTFLLTFPTIQDCRNAVSEMDGTKFEDKISIHVFQAEGLAGNV